MIGAENVHFQSSDVQAGDPEKLKYLHSGRHGYPKWEGKIRSQVAKVDERACPGCMFPDAPPGKWPHVKDDRCAKWRAEYQADCLKRFDATWEKLKAVCPEGAA